VAVFEGVGVLVGVGVVVGGEVFVMVAVTELVFEAVGVEDGPLVFVMVGDSTSSVDVGVIWDIAVEVGVAVAERAIIA
jgi:hypothetical protein